MPTEIQKFGDTMIRVIHEPGNRTRYEAVGIKMPKEFPEVGGYWLIHFPSSGGAYYFQEGVFISVEYVALKLQFNVRGMKLAETDLHEMTKCITIITGGKNNAATDDRGQFPEERLLRIAQ